MNQKIKLIPIVYFIFFLKFLKSEKDPFFGCRFCLSCGGDYPFYGGSKHFYYQVPSINSTYSFYGENCTGQAIIGISEWKFCCGKDEELNIGLCKFCLNCGSDYKQFSGSRTTIQYYGGSQRNQTFTYFGSECNSSVGKMYFNNKGDFSLCCTRKNQVQLCFKCNNEQSIGGAFSQGIESEMFIVNQMGSCGINDNYFAQTGDYYLCNNKICPDNHQLIDNKCIYFCQENCLSCDSNNECLKCLPSFYLINGKCFASVCVQQAATQPFQCLKCQKGFYLKQGWCIQCNVRNCADCRLGDDLLTVQCVQCNVNYLINQNQQCDPLCPLNCQKCIDFDECLQCRKGYKQITVNEKVTCSPVICPSYCICEKDNVCIKCQPGYKQLGTSNEIKCDPIPCSEGCICEENNICKYCQEGYRLEMVAQSSNYQCILSCPEKCEKCNPSTYKTCDRCIQGYSKNFMGQCFQCNIKNCEQCYYEESEKNLKCQYCKTDYILDSNQLNCNPLCPENCKSCIEPNVCIKCKEGYKQVMNPQKQIICQQIICVTNCKYCIDDYECAECDDGYEISKNSHNCIKIQCKPNCVCTKYILEECSQGFTILNNQCIPECTLGRYFEKNQCKFCKVPFCERCSSESVCVACNEQYSLRVGFYNQEEQISCEVVEDCQTQKDVTYFPGTVCIIKNTFSSFRSIGIQIILLIFLF